MTTLLKPFTQAMAFYHQDGLVPAEEQALQFAGKRGRLATLPDIIAARINSKPGEVPWETYFTTLSAEYYGIGKKGKPLLIIAHGVGPMATIEGITQAYSWEYQDRDRYRRGGRITLREFWDLESGKYGEVSIVDLDSYCALYEFPFLQPLRSSQAMTDPVLKARLGPQAEEYLALHTAMARTWHLEQVSFDPENKYQLPNYEQFLTRRRLQHAQDGATSSDPYIVEVRDATNCCYTFGSRSSGHTYRQLEKGYAMAHLLSTGRLVHLHHERNESLTLDFSCHEWHNGVRLVAIPSGVDIRKGIHPGPDPHRLLRSHWRDLLLPVKKPVEVGFRALMQIGDQWFTQYPKAGERMDTWEPEYIVTAVHPIGDPMVFRTPVVGYHGFFRFAINELQSMAPPGANAYHFIGEPQIESLNGQPTHHSCVVQFYSAEVDNSQRLMRVDKLAHFTHIVLRLLAKEAVS